MDFIADGRWADLVRVLVALGIGAVIGAEREYRSKAAGFRTLTLICLGSAIFTIVSMRLGANSSPDRIASNVVTGIGFFGAGVIFKDGITISGLTTATSIWATAALGMAAGAGYLGLASLGVLLVLTVLAAFGKLQGVIDNLHQMRSYSFQFSAGMARADLDDDLRRFNVKFKLRRVIRKDDVVSCWYDVWGSERALGELSQYALNAHDILSVEYSA